MLCIYFYSSRLLGDGFIGENQSQGEVHTVHTTRSVQMVMACWISWFYSKLIGELINTYFYTELSYQVAPLTVITGTKASTSSDILREILTDSFRSYLTQKMVTRRDPRHLWTIHYTRTQTRDIITAYQHNDKCFGKYLEVGQQLLNRLSMCHCEWGFQNCWNPHYC